VDVEQGPMKQSEANVMARQPSAIEHLRGPHGKVSLSHLSSLDDADNLIATIYSDDDMSVSPPST